MCSRKAANSKSFNTVLQNHGVIRALCVPQGGDKYSNTQLKPEGEINRHAQIFGAKGVAWFRCIEDGKLDSNIVKFFSDDCIARLVERLGAKTGDLILLVADREKVAATAMGQLRLKIAEDLNLIDRETFRLAWITDFPLVDWNEKENRWDPAHHPFTMPGH